MVQYRSVIWGTLYLLLGLVAGPVLAVKYEDMFYPVTFGWLKYAGIVLFVLGVPLTLYCTYLLFIPGKDHPIPYESQKDFRPAGPYRYCRNPFFDGWYMVLWGEALYMEMISMLAYAAILSFSVFFWITCCEEPSLEEAYGEEYISYKRVTPRFVPHFWKKPVEGRHITEIPRSKNKD